MKWVIIIGSFCAPIIAYFTGKFFGKKGFYDSGEASPIETMSKAVEESDEEYEEMPLDDIVDAANDEYGGYGGES